MKLLILGCLSHLGVNFIKYLTENGYSYDIVGVDKISYCSQSHHLIDKYPIKVFIQADILSLDLEDIINTYQINIVINCAAETHVDRSYTHMREFINSNILLVDKLINCIISLKKSNKEIKLIHFSTDEIYGDKYSTHRKETDMPNPTNPYSATKASGDMIINGYINSYNLLNDILVLRPNNLCGMYQYHDKVIPLFFKNIIQGKCLIIHGDGNQRRNFILTEDVCRLILLICIDFKNFVKIKNKYNNANAVVNVSTSDSFGISILNLAILFKTELKKDNEIIFSRDRPHNDKYYMISNDLLKKIIQELINKPSNNICYKLSIELLIGLQKKSTQVVRNIIQNLNLSLSEQSQHV